MTQKLHVLIIDPQVDFCDPAGTLYVQGANEDAKRLGAMIDRLGKRIDDIHVTLDTHHYWDIAHPVFWCDASGKAPAPFTIINPEDIRDGVWKPRNPADTDYAIAYTTSLRDNGRYALCIWPPHCLIGSPGHNVIGPVYEAVTKWERECFAMVDYVTKGSNYKTEHYSAVQADVPDPQDPSTMLNTQLINILMEADIIALSGQALSHCVANTVRDIADNFGDDNIRKLVLIEDTTSSVTGFEDLGKTFVKDMKARGMQTALSTDFLV